MHKYIKRIMFTLLSAAFCTAGMPALTVQAAQTAPVYVDSEQSDLLPLSDIEITGVIPPTAGEAFDTTAEARASDGTTWTVSVFWLGTQEITDSTIEPTDTAHPLVASDGTIWQFSAYQNETEGEDTSVSASFTVTTKNGGSHTLPIYPIQASGEKANTAEDNTLYIPLLVFYLPDGYTCDGQVEPGGSLSGIYYMNGGTISIFAAESGITYITGKMKFDENQSEAAGESVQNDLVEVLNPLQSRPESIPPLEPTNIPSLSSIINP
jgi:hypothetical protein